MAKRKLTPRSNEGPPPGGWTLEEALRKLAGEERVEAYLTAKRRHHEAENAPKRVSIPSMTSRAWSATDKAAITPREMGELRHRQRVDVEYLNLSKCRAEMMDRFLAALDAGPYVALGRPRDVNADFAAITADQWGSLDDLEIEKSKASESRPGGGCFVSVRVFLTSEANPPQSKGGRPSSIDWFAALDEFLLAHIRGAEFESKKMMVEKLSDAIRRTGRDEPDQSTVRRWLSDKLPRFYDRTDTQHGQENSPKSSSPRQNR